MKAAIIPIGNSLGLRIPKPILKQCGFEKEVELEVQDKRLIIKSSHKARQKHFRQCTGIKTTNSLNLHKINGMRKNGNGNKQV